MKKINLIFLCFILNFTVAFAGDNTIDGKESAVSATTATTPAPAPDKSIFNLFNPTPADLMRPLETDRPTKANSPYTVDAGHFLMESDLFNYTYDQKSGVRNESYFVATPVLKLGLLNNVDLEVTLSPYNSVRSQNLNTGVTTSADGFGDVLTRIKVNVIGNDSGSIIAALIPYIKAPTASGGVGNGQVEGGLITPISFSLPADWTLTFQNSIDVLEDTTGLGHHAATSNLLNFNHTLFDKNLTGYIEFYSNVSTEQNSGWQGTADLALSYIIEKNYQIDGGVNIGVTNPAPEVNPYIGFSARY